ncbi:MAG: aminopeptidase P family protein [Bdellovibrionota bacterium]
MSSINQRLNALREQMKKHQLDFYLVPSSDDHNNEYLPECWQRRPWISGFTGSAGEVLVSHTNAYLWTDGRYFTQAENELDPKLYTLMPQKSFAPETEQWLSNSTGKTLGIDPHVLGIDRVNKLMKAMTNVNGKIALIDTNLVDESRKQLGETLQLPKAKAFLLEERICGESVSQKLIWLRSELTNNKVNHIALSVLDEIAWLFNIRGSDIEFNPLVISYAIIGLNDAHLFVEKSKLSPQILDALNQNKIHVDAYENFGNGLNNLKGTVWLDEMTASFWMQQKINPTSQIKFARSPIVHKKARKNNAEIEGAKQAHMKDAIALMNFFCWLNNNWKSGVDELICAEKLYEFRTQLENFVGSSFQTISGFADNGAVIHYHPTQKTNKVVDGSSLFLLDSGGQFLEGTTDITRTVHLGHATAEQKRHYTLVLKGHLAVGRAIFTHGTCGEHLDALARTPLWNEYLNYRHGTGHGVGSFLCVHEGPQKISQMNSGVPLLPGMIVSNEPGLYLKNKYGIRIENLCVVTKIESQEAQASEFGPFYQFENLTMMPYCKALIDVELLTKEELAQIRTYYSSIKASTYHFLTEPVQKWLTEETSI